MELLFLLTYQKIRMYEKRDLASIDRRNRPTGSEASGHSRSRLAMDRGKAGFEMDLLKRSADRIAFLIVASDYPEIDLTIEEEKLRDLCARLFPDRLDLFEMIYSARFQRLKEQFRSPE
ncbi:MAG: hypothetical protein ACYTG7_03805 [Planctomycetota bacterium]|jgi:hypothetical protein